MKIIPIGLLILGTQDNQCFLLEWKYTSLRKQMQMNFMVAWNIKRDVVVVIHFLKAFINLRVSEFFRLCISILVWCVIEPMKIFYLVHCCKWEKINFSNFSNLILIHRIWAAGIKSGLKILESNHQCPVRNLGVSKNFRMNYIKF